ncbi:MAG: Pyrimidine-specific ribonucleoside hydrolase RihA [Chlamydiae bacterium]|nr:Pyrimidine-specific ribonucleoside hydrolase RihA [Chlamydiota bacterium]
MKKKLFAFLLILTSLTFSPLYAGKDKARVIVDTDCDMDDMMAILFLLKRKNVKLLAVTTTGTGMTTWKHTAPNILSLLKLAHHPRIPVAYGAKKSLSPYSSFPSSWRKGIDDIYDIPMPKSRVKPSKLSSWELLAKTVHMSDEKVTLLCLAPMTNIALALKNDPSIKENIERIIISGGAIKANGNIVGKVKGVTNHCAEYNVFLDAKAAQTVISSGIPITLVPLDSTEKAPISKNFYEAFANTKRNSSANFVFEVIKPFVKAQPKTSVYLWDPVAAAVLSDPEIGSYEKMNIVVSQKDGECYGCTERSELGTPIDVCTTIDTVDFYSLFFKTITRGN